MKRGLRSFLSVALTLSMLLSLCVPAWAVSSPVSGAGTSDNPFQLISTSDITAYKISEGNYALGNDPAKGLSSSYITASGGTNTDAKTYTGLVATGLVVGAGECVALSANLPTEIRGNGTLLYKNGGSAAPMITGVAPGVGLNALNTLSISEGQTACVTGAFGNVTGVVQPVGDVTLGAGSYTVNGKNTAHAVTIKGNASVSGLFSSLTISSGATVTITADTYISGSITNNGKLTVRQGVTLCVNGVSVKPGDKDVTIQTWSPQPTLPAGVYTAAAGSWTLGGDVTVNTTACGYTGHTGENTLNATLNDHTLTVKGGTVKALDSGTVVGDGGEATLQVAGEGVKAHGAFKSITMDQYDHDGDAGTATVPYGLTVLAGETISAEYDGGINSVTVEQNTVFTEFNGVLPVSGDENNPYKFSNLSGKWQNSTSETEITETYVGNNASLTVNKDGMVISGIFTELNTNNHSVTLGGDTRIKGGTFTVAGDSSSPYNLTIDGGTGTVTGTLRTLTVNDGTVTDKSGSQLKIDNTKKSEIYTGVQVNGGTLTLSHTPDIKINGNANYPAVEVLGGTLTMLNGSVETWKSDAHAIDVGNGGTVNLGDESGIEMSETISIPQVTCHGGSSTALFVNNGGKAYVYSGIYHFTGSNSEGIHVNESGEAYLYPNDSDGEKNLTLNKPLIHVYGELGAKAAVWVDYNGLIEIRGRGALLEQPERNDNAGYALYIHSAAKAGCVLAGGTFNGDVFYQTNQTHTIPSIIPVNHYLRFDETSPNYAASDGSYGILPYRAEEYTDAYRYGNYVTKHGEANEFNETYLNRFGKRGEYYSIVDAEWELRQQMTVEDGSYQIPAGLLNGSGAVTNTLELDKKTPANWAIGKMQGDLNVSGTGAKLYLAGRTLTYDGASTVTQYLTDVVSGTQDTFKDKLHTVAVTGGLTVIDAVSGGTGTSQAANQKFTGGYIGTGTIAYTGTANDETAAVHVCTGTLNVVSGELVNGNANNESSGVYLHGGTASFGTATGSAEVENNDNAIIQVSGVKQALKVTAGEANVYGGTLKATADSAEAYGAVLTGGALNVKGGVLSGNNGNLDRGCGVYATGGIATITGGGLYGIYRNDSSNSSGNSLCVSGATVNVQIDEAHKGYTAEATAETGGRHHICNINVKSGTLNVGTRGATTDNYLRNNGTLTLEGGTTYYFDGVTVGNTEVYGTNNASDFGTRFFVESGHFGDLFVYNDGKSSMTYTVNLNKYVQLHGGYFKSITNNAAASAPASSVQSLIGVWLSEDHDGTSGADWARYNHYAATVSSQRSERGEWSAVTTIQSGTAKTDAGQQIESETGKAVSIRSAADEFETWAKGGTPSTFKLYANLWLDEDVLCSAEYCDAAHDPVTVAAANRTLDLNGFGIFGKTDDALLTVDGGSLTVRKGSANASEAYADRIRNFGSGAAVNAAAGGTLTVDGAQINSNSGSAITTAGTTTIKSGTFTGANYGVDQSAGTLAITGGTFTGATYGLHRANTASADNRNFITAGTFNGIQTAVTGEKLSDLLAKDKTFHDHANIEVGADVLNKNAIENGANSGDSATGGESVKWTDDDLTVIAYDTTLAEDFTVTDRTVNEITLESKNANTTIAVSDAVKAALDSNTSVNNATKTLYIAKDGGSATATITPDDNYCTGVVTRNGSDNAALSHKSAQQTVSLTAKDSSLTAAAQAFHIDDSGVENGINKSISGKTYTLTGSNLAKPTVQKESGGSWVDASSDVTITAISTGYTVEFPDQLNTDYKLTATVIRAGGGIGGGAAPAPATTVSVSGDENSVSISASVSGGTATMSEPTDKELEKVIGAGVETGEVVINMSGLNDSVTTAAIPASTVKAVEKAVSDTTNDASGLTIKLPNATATFDAAALSAITNQAKESSLALNVEEVAVSKLASAQQSALKGLDVQELISVTLKSGTAAISDFGGGSATVSVSYTLKAGQNARGIVVWYVAGDGTLTEIPAAYANGMVTFTTTHFSDYVIAYDAARAAACPQDSTCPIAAFADADATAWYHDGVHWALENGAMSGYDNPIGKGKLFTPNSDTTRAMVAQILWNLEGKPAYVGMSEYGDVDNEAWYGPAIRWASAEGIVTGYENPTGTGMLFDPDGAVTREQLAAMLYRYAQYKKADVSASANLSSFGDAGAVSDWATAAMQWAVGAGIVNGADGKLLPQGNASRAQVATMLMRYSTAK